MNSQRNSCSSGGHRNSTPTASCPATATREGIYAWAIRMRRRR
jgi:hypothetical protein